MNLKLLVKLSNIVAAISIVLLIYWVFVFISIEVFGFKIFRENISQTFAMSVLGILALMGGSLMINVMFNLTRIAQKHNQDQIAELKSSPKKWIIALALTFPIIFGVLFAGDYMTSQKKQNMLVQSAKSIIETNSVRSEGLLNYEFNNQWLNETRDTLDFFEKTEKNFPNVSVIVRDSVTDAPVFLAFREYREMLNDQKVLVQPEKQSFLMRTTKIDRDYLNKVFDEGYSEIKFSASDGNYELFYPYVKGDKRIVLYFSDYQRYGKMGS